MKKSHKLIVASIFIITILLIIFLSKDFIIRKYFISILENVDYDEYILELSINGKKSAIYYYTPEYVMERHYDDNEQLNKDIIIKPYFQSTAYHYFFQTDETILTPEDISFIKPTHINNDHLLSFLDLNVEADKKTFTYKGITNINNIKCHTLEFKNKNLIITTFYLSKELLYTIRIDTNISNPSSSNHIIYDYTLDLTLNKKSLFEF